MAFDVSFIYRIVDRYSGKLDKIQRKTDGFRGAVDRMAVQPAKGLGKLAGSLNRIGGRLRAIPSMANSASAAMGALAISYPINKAMAYEDTITDLEKKFGDLAAGNLAASLADLAPDLGMTVTEINRLGFAAGKLDVAADDVARFVELSSKAATAFDGLAMEDAGDTIGSLKSKMQLGMDGVEGLLDAINILADNTSATGGQITKVVERMSAQFNALKFPPHIAAGFAAFARQVTTSDELAASGLKQFTNKLIEMGHQADLQRAPVETINKVLNKIRELPEGTQGGVIIDMFGLEASTFVQSLVTNGELLNDTLGKVANTSKFAGSMNAEFARVSGNASFKVDALKAKFDRLITTLGTQLMPTFHKLVEAAGPLLEKFTGFVEKNPGMIKLVAGAVAFGAAFIALAGTIGAVMLVFNPIALAIGAGLAAMTAAVVLFWDQWKALASWLSSVFMPIFDGIGKVMGGIGGVITGALDFLGINDGPDVASQGAASQRNRLDGKIGVEVSGPGKVTDTEIRSDAPGNLGMNVATAGAM